MNMRLIVRTIAIAATSIMAVPFGAYADEQAVPLSKFEAEVSNSLALRASSAGVDQAQESLLAARARSGLQVTANAQAGPRHDVVDNYVSRSFSRYEADVGVRMPILGARAAQMQDVLLGQEQLQLAQLDYRATQLALLAKVRQYYIAYWTASRKQVVAQAYAEELAGEAPASGALRANGFWTQADQLRYTNMLQKARTEVSRAYAAQQDALTQLSLITNRNVSAFAPVEPPFANCRTSAPIALSLAINEDPELARLKAEIAQAQALAPLQRWQGFDTNVDVGLRSYVDRPGGVGYGVYVAAGFAAPVQATRAQVAEKQRVESALHQYDLLAQERRAELQTAVTVALSDRHEASRELAQAQNDYRTLAEDVRESRVRLAYVAPSSLSEVQQKTQSEYTAQAALIDDEGAVLLKTSDLLQVAPDACSPSVVMQHGDSNQ